MTPDARMSNELLPKLIENLKIERGYLFSYLSTMPRYGSETNQLEGALKSLDVAIGLARGVLAERSENERPIVPYEHSKSFLSEKPANEENGR